MRNKIYISKPLTMDEVPLLTVCSTLKRLGFETSYYNPKKKYSIELIQNADIVLFLSSSADLKNNHYTLKLPKGQTSELEFCRDNNKPCYFISNLIYRNDSGLLLNNFEFDTLKIVNKNDWKYNYSTVKTNNVYDRFSIVDIKPLNRKLLLI